MVPCHEGLRAAARYRICSSGGRIGAWPTAADPRLASGGASAHDQRRWRCIFLPAAHLLPQWPWPAAHLLSSGTSSSPVAVADGRAAHIFCRDDSGQHGMIGHRAHPHGTSQRSLRSVVPGPQLRHGGTRRHDTSKPPGCLVSCLAVWCPIVWLAMYIQEESVDSSKQRGFIRFL